MEALLWQTGLVASKLVFYFCLAFGLANIFVGHFIKAQRFTPFIYLLACLISLPTIFLSTVGYMNESGWSGIFDEFMIALLWEESLGTSLVIKGVSVVLFLLVALLQCKNFPPVLVKFLVCSGLMLLGLSHAYSGHIEVLGDIDRIAIGVHLAVAYWWSAWLIAFIFLAKRIDMKTFTACLERFGRWALVNVLALLACGALLVLSLIDPLETIFDSPYGWVLLLKLACVGMVLLLAARHKWQLVPRLLSTADTTEIKRSIKNECMLMGAVVLLATTMATSLSP